MDENGTSANLFARRDFVKYLLAGSALSLGAIEKLNAGVYQAITSLNQKYVEDISPDGVYWDEIRKMYLFEDKLIMMNNGTLGPMPRPVFNTLMRYFRIQASNPYDLYNFVPGGKESVRAKLAAFVGASPDEIAFSSNTTEGLNLVANGLDMKEGDEVIVSNLEHPGAINPWNLKAKRTGIKIVEVPFSTPAQSVEQIVKPFAAAITPRTKIIAVGHTVFITGQITPLKELSKMAHEKGVLVMGDSAHGIGMLSLNMHDMGVDFFGSSPYKWLGAPTGIGLFYVRKEIPGQALADHRLLRLGGRQRPQVRSPGPAGGRHRLCPGRGSRLPEPHRQRADRAPDQGPGRLPQAGPGQDPGRDDQHPVRRLPQRRPDGVPGGRRGQSEDRGLRLREIQAGHPDDGRVRQREAGHPRLDADLHLDQRDRHAPRGRLDARQAQSSIFRILLAFL